MWTPAEDKRLTPATRLKGRQVVLTLTDQWVLVLGKWEPAERLKHPPRRERATCSAAAVNPEQQSMINNAEVHKDHGPSPNYLQTPRNTPPPPTPLARPPSLHPSPSLSLPAPGFCCTNQEQMSAEAVLKDPAVLDASHMLFIQRWRLTACLLLKPIPPPIPPPPPPKKEVEKNKLSKRLQKQDLHECTFLSSAPCAATCWNHDWKELKKLPVLKFMSTEHGAEQNLICGRRFKITQISQARVQTQQRSLVNYTLVSRVVKLSKPNIQGQMRNFTYAGKFLLRDSKWRFLLFCFCFFKDCAWKQLHLK